MEDHHVVCLLFILLYKWRFIYREAEVGDVSYHLIYLTIKILCIKHHRSETT